MSDREHDLIVLGATGFVGRLLAAYLARQAPAGLRVALAGRSRERLEQVRASLPVAANGWPLVVCDATVPEQVAALARSTRVVVTTVGPYARYGLPLVRACAEAGTHYGDLTGETLFVRDAIDAAHDTAVSTGARVVTACGFDSIPSDLGVHLLHGEADRLELGGLGDTTLLVTRLSGGFSGGTVDSMRSQIEALQADPSRRRVVFDPFALSTDRASEPDRSGQRDAMYVFRDETTGRWTAPWLMASFNSRIVRRSDSLLGHPYGSRFRYREAVGFGRGNRARLEAYGLAVALGTAYAAMANPLTRSLADRVLPSPGEGPGEQARDEGYFRVELRTTTEQGRRLLAVVSAQGDPGYAATAVMLGESALCLALDQDRLSSGGGVLTPAVAMGDVLVERLRIAGMTLTVGPDAA
ncbi:MAG: saccharopine dehydrogenase NADP-binding domain-containing protein [Lapillicoccus sp.]